MRTLQESCANCLKLFKVYDSKYYINLLMECQIGGCLSDVRLRTEKEVKIVMAQILLTVDHLQKRSIVHRDLKPDNILLHRPAKDALEIRMADFGFASQIKDPKNDDNNHETTTLICGTSGYIAPEVLAG